MRLHEILKNRFKLINEKLLELEKKILTNGVDYRSLAKRQELIKRIRQFMNTFEIKIKAIEQAKSSNKTDNLKFLKADLDQIISELRENLIRQKMKVVKSKDPFITTFFLPGLKYEAILDNRSCFFDAVGRYLGKNQDELRQFISDHVKANKRDYSDFMELSRGKSPEDYIAGIANQSWVDYLEIEALMDLLKRPILIITPDSKIRNLDDANRYPNGEPIFVYYNGENHYDALLRIGDKSGREILQNILHSKPTERAEIMQLYHELIQLASLSKLRPEEIAPNEKQLKQSEFLQTQQKLADKNADFQLALLELKKLAKKNHRKISVFVSYAWPSDDRPYESWVQPFLEVFAKHLEQAHVRVLWDIHSSRFGFNSYEFMDEILESNYVILIGTESLVDKHTRGISSVCNELNRIRERRIKDYDKGLHRVIPLVISGEVEKAVPCEYMRYTVIESFKGGGYIKTVLQLLCHILELPKEEFVKHWKKLEAIASVDSVFTAIDAVPLDYLQEKFTEKSLIHDNFDAGFLQILKNNYLSRHRYLQCLFNDKKFPIDTHYVDLAIISDTEQREKEKAFAIKNDLFIPNNPINIADIFDRCKALPDGSRRIIARGRAGIGKSTVCKRMVYLWANGQLWQGSYLAVFWISFRHLTKSNYPTDRRYELHEIIHQECFNNQLTDEQYQALIKALKEKRDQFLLILDGYDELPAVAASGYLQSAVKALLNYPQVFLTSRPQVITEIDAQLELEVIGFSDKNIESYIANYFNNGTNALALNEFLKKNIQAKSTAHIPINLELLCGIWQDAKLTASDIPTFTSLYQKMVTSLLGRYLSKEKLSLEEVRRMPERVIEASCEHLPAYLNAIAWRAMEEDIIYLPEGLILEEMDKVDILAKNNLSLEEKSRRDIDRLQLIHYRSGFLRLTADEMHQRKAYFTHLTFQEFFAAHYFVNIIDQAKSNPEQYEAFREKFKMYKFNPRFEVVWWFVAGVLRNKNDEMMRRFYDDFLFASQSDLLQQYEMPLLVRCLEESGVPEERGVKIFPIKKQVSNWIVGEIYQVHTNGLPNSSDSYFYHPFYNVLAQSPLFSHSMNIVHYFKSLINGSSRLARQYIVYVLSILAKSLLLDDKKEVAKLLVEILEEKVNDDIQKISIRALVELASELPLNEILKAVETLIAQLGDEGLDIRQHAVRGLVKLINSLPLIERKKPIAMTIEALQDSNALVQECSIRLIEKLTPILNQSEKLTAIETLIGMFEKVKIVSKIAARVASALLNDLSLEEKIKIQSKLLNKLDDLNGRGQKYTVRFLGKLMTNTSEENQLKFVRILMDALVNNLFEISLFASTLPQDEWVKIANALAIVIAETLTECSKKVALSTEEKESDSEDEKCDDLFNLLCKLVKLLNATKFKQNIEHIIDPLNLLTIQNKILEKLSPDLKEKVLLTLLQYSENKSLRFEKDAVIKIIEKLFLTLSPDEFTNLLMAIFNIVVNDIKNSNYLSELRPLVTIIEDIDKNVIAEIALFYFRMLKYPDFKITKSNILDKILAITKILTRQYSLSSMLDSPAWIIRLFGFLSFTSSTVEQCRKIDFDFDKSMDIDASIDLYLGIEKITEVLLKFLKDSHPLMQALVFISSCANIFPLIAKFDKDNVNDNIKIDSLDSTDPEYFDKFTRISAIETIRKPATEAFIKIIQQPNPFINITLPIIYDYLKALLKKKKYESIFSNKEKEQINKWIIKALGDPLTYFFDKPKKLIKLLPNNMRMQVVTALTSAVSLIVAQLNSVNLIPNSEYKSKLLKLIANLSEKEKILLLKEIGSFSKLKHIRSIESRLPILGELPLLIADQATVSDLLLKDLQDRLNISDSQENDENSNYQSDSDSDDNFISNKLLDTLLPGDRIKFEKNLINTFSNENADSKTKKYAASLLIKSFSNTLDNEWRLEAVITLIRLLRISNDISSKVNIIRMFKQLIATTNDNNQHFIFEAFNTSLLDNNEVVRFQAVGGLDKLSKEVPRLRLNIAEALLPILLDADKNVQSEVVCLLKRHMDVLPEDKVIQVIIILLKANETENIKLKYLFMVLKPLPSNMIDKSLINIDDLREKAANAIAGYFKKAASPLYFYKNNLCFHEDGVEHRIQVQDIKVAIKFAKSIQSAFLRSPDSVLLLKEEQLIHQAIKRNDLPELKRLLNLNIFDLNNQNNTEKMTALMLATSLGNIEIVKILLSHGAEINLLNSRYESAINIALQKMHIEIARLLLSHRPSITLSQLNLILESHYEDYVKKIGLSDADAILDKLLAVLIGVENISEKKIKERKNYLAHLQSFSSIKSDNRIIQELEGFFVEDFLPLRISHYIRLIFDIQRNALIDFEEHSKEKVLVALKREILLACETYQLNSESNLTINYPELMQAIQYNILNKLQHLSVGDELVYRTGFNGHCIYATFIRDHDHIIGRLDNVGAGSLSHHEITGRSLRTKLNKLKPYYIGIWPIGNDLTKNDSLNKYLADITRAKGLEEHKALPLLYQSTPNKPNLPITNQWVAKRRQIVGNCTLRSYSVGMHIRLGRSLYQFLMVEESKLLLKKQNNITINETTSLIKNSIFVTKPLLTHIELMEKFSEALHVDYKEVYEGRAVEQAFVRAAGVERDQTNACYRRNNDGTTYFELNLDTDDLEKFTDYYRLLFPKLILQVEYLSLGNVKITVNTEVLSTDVLKLLSTQEKKSCALV